MPTNHHTMTDQLEIELPSGRIALATVELEPTEDHATDHWISGGSVCSRDRVERGWRVCDVEEVALLLPNSTERPVRKGSKLWNTIARRVLNQAA
jgi:hypothetical protein